MKRKILKLLREKKGYVSGQELCEQMGVSRTAIWKVMNQLKEEGYVIDSISNKGYQLVYSPDIVTSYAIGSFLDTTWLGQTIEYYEELDSTNVKAKEIGNRQNSNGTVVITERQTAGRGRRGRTWESPDGTGIWMSLVLEPKIAPEHASMLTLVAAMAVVEGIQRELNVQASIKWPNDIILNNKKVCGILTEMSCELDYIHYVVIGIGINANMMEFPQEIGSIATSLALETHNKVNRASLTAHILKALEEYYEVFSKTEDMSILMEAYNSKLMHRNKKVRILGKEEYQAEALGIDHKGQLVVQCENGEKRTVLSGEVSIRGMYGYCD